MLESEVNLKSLKLVALIVGNWGEAPKEKADTTFCGVSMERTPGDAVLVSCLVALSCDTNKLSGFSSGVFPSFKYERNFSKGYADCAFCRDWMA